MVDANHPKQALARLEQVLSSRIAILDGAMGTALQDRKLVEADYRGELFKDHGHDLAGNERRPRWCPAR